MGCPATDLNRGSSHKMQRLKAKIDERLYMVLFNWNNALSEIDRFLAINNFRLVGWRKGDPLNCIKSCFCSGLAHHFAVTDRLRVIGIRHSRKAYPGFASDSRPVNMRATIVYLPVARNTSHALRRCVRLGSGASPLLKSLDVSVLCNLRLCLRCTSVP